MKFAFKERGLPTDGSYKPKVEPVASPDGGSPTTLSASSSSTDLRPSTPVVQGSPEVSNKALNRVSADTSTALGRSASTPQLAHSPRSLLARQESRSGSINGSVSRLHRADSVSWTRSAASPTLGQHAEGRKRSPSTAVTPMSSPKSITDVFDKGRMHMNDGDFAKGVTCFTDVLCETLLQRAFCLIQMEKYAEALHDLDVALHFKGDHGKALIRKAKVLALLGKIAEAKEARAAAIPLVKDTDPELWEVNNLCGVDNSGAAPRTGVSGSFSGGQVPLPRSGPAAAAESSDANKDAAPAEALSPSAVRSPKSLPKAPTNRDSLSGSGGAPRSLVGVPPPSTGTPDPTRRAKIPPTSAAPRAPPRQSASEAPEQPSPDVAPDTPGTERRKLALPAKLPPSAADYKSRTSMSRTSGAGPEPPHEIPEVTLSPKATGSPRRTGGQSPRSGSETSPRAGGGADMLDLKLSTRCRAGHDCAHDSLTARRFCADYKTMSDADLPPLPSNPPTVDEDMLRWQQASDAWGDGPPTDLCWGISQFMRLKNEYKSRQLPVRFAVWNK